MMQHGGITRRGSVHQAKIAMKKSTITKRYSAVDAMLLALQSTKGRTSFGAMPEEEDSAGDGRSSVVSLPDPDTEDIL